MSKIERENLRVVAEKAILAGVQLPRAYIDLEDPFSELRALAQTAGAEIVGELLQKRQKPRGRTYIGRGKVQELADLVKLTRATLVIFDNDLSPAQVKALEEGTECKIIDRSELILDIFANRAATHAAKLQVEIAQLEYTYPRLRAMWDHLGQIVGGAPVGIGTRGPGEKQLEIDRRLVRRRRQQLRGELVTIQKRKAREVAQRNLGHYTVGAVGYTNAGKSSLFNRATAGGAFAHDKLFATLSTRTERWDLGGGNAAMLSDTVGFIRDLPHQLVASFRSTLEEIVHAQLILVVLDVVDPHAEMQLETVSRTLDELGATAQPRVLVLNKIDRLQDSRDLLVWMNRYPEAMPISALKGEGIDELAEIVLEHMLGGIREVRVTVPASETRTIDFLEKRTEVLERDYRNRQAAFRVRMGRRHVDQLLAQGTEMQINGLDPLEAVRREWSLPRPASVLGARAPATRKR